MWRFSAGYLDELPLKNLDSLSRILEGIATATKPRRNSVPIIPSSLPRADIALLLMCARNQGTRVTESRLSQVEVWWRMIMLFFVELQHDHLHRNDIFLEDFNNIVSRTKIAPDRTTRLATTIAAASTTECGCDSGGSPVERSHLASPWKGCECLVEDVGVVFCWWSCSFDLNDTNCEYSFDFECMLWCT